MRTLITHLNDPLCSLVAKALNIPELCYIDKQHITEGLQSKDNDLLIGDAWTTKGRYSGSEPFYDAAPYNHEDWGQDISKTIQSLKEKGLQPVINPFYLNMDNKPQIRKLQKMKHGKAKDHKGIECMLDECTPNSESAATSAKISMLLSAINDVPVLPMEKFTFNYKRTGSDQWDTGGYRVEIPNYKVSATGNINQDLESIGVNPEKAVLLGHHLMVGDDSSDEISPENVKTTQLDKILVQPVCPCCFAGGHNSVDLTEAGYRLATGMTSAEVFGDRYVKAVRELVERETRLFEKYGRQ